MIDVEIYLLWHPAQLQQLPAEYRSMPFPCDLKQAQFADLSQPSLQICDGLVIFARKDL